MTDVGKRHSVFRRAVVPVAAFLGVVVAGFSGYVVLTDIGYVEAAFWLIDPTSIELHFAEHPDEDAEKATKLYAVAVSGALVVTGVWIAESVLTAAFGGKFKDELRKMQVKKQIGELEDHVVVCGYGMFGETIAENLADRDVDVVVVEIDEADYERVLNDGHLALNADARREDALEEAGVERARSVVAAVDDSNTNVETAIVVSQLSPDCRMVVRVGDRMHESLARRAGADEVVIPEVMTGETVTDIL
ncbi:MAG: NAD(P)-binding protein [Halobacteriales archaeon]|nr:NAD(P)-binding protein [Halobacteriales archaeon]